MKETIQNLHQAAQYLAAAGISFLDKKPDDSHTNLAWNSQENRMETHVFGNLDALALNLKNITLEWLKNGSAISKIDLQSKSHSEIVQWISQQAETNNIAKPYSYSFHYELPYNALTDDYISSFSSENLESISNELNKAQQAFEQFLDSQKLESPIRIWPHHFDLGIYSKLEADNTFMGAGLAIPDSLVNDFYFYASAYKNGQAIETKNFGKMTNGEWRSDWNGATLASSNIEVNNALVFLNEAKSKFNHH
jgi:hypothetical protein